MESRKGLSLEDCRCACKEDVRCNAWTWIPGIGKLQNYFLITGPLTLKRLGGGLLGRPKSKIIISQKMFPLTHPEKSRKSLSFSPGC